MTSTEMTRTTSPSTLPLGQLLGLPLNHHFFHLPVFLAKELGSDPNKLVFVLLFEMDQKPQLVAATTVLGYAAKWQSVSYFSKRELLEGLTLVPLLALTSCQVLALPLGQQDLISVRQLYPNLEGLSHLQDELTYNPYRDAYEAPSGKGEISYQVSDSERDYEQELQAFELSRKGEVKQVPLIYQDLKRDQNVKLYVRGWYLFDNQPPLQISWKPAHTRKASWRSSYVGVDKKTGRFFFRGELYKDKQRPIFLDGLTFARQEVSDQVITNWEKMVAIIQEQKDRYLANQPNNP